jgi:serine/threonine-protein kinase RsbT
MTPSSFNVSGVSADVMPLLTGEDVVRLRQVLRKHVQDIGLSLVEQTKFVTAASELARNTLDYGGGGEVKIEILKEDSRKGIRLAFSDRGPGIPDIQLALSDGYTSGGGMGLGLGGAKRLSDEFHIDTGGQGTTVTITKWKAF